MRTGRTINPEGQQFPRPQFLTPDDDHIGQNMLWKICKVTNF
jgi:hypothetical protein